MATMASQGLLAMGKSSPDLFKRRVLWLSLTVLIVMTVSYLSHKRHSSVQPAASLHLSQPHDQAPQTEKEKPKEKDWTFVVGRDDLNFGLSDEQCDVSSTRNPHNAVQPTAKSGSPSLGIFSCFSFLLCFSEDARTETAL